MFRDITNMLDINCTLPEDTEIFLWVGAIGEFQYALVMSREAAWVPGGQEASLRTK